MEKTKILNKENSCAAVFKGTLTLIERPVGCLFRRPSLTYKNMNVMKKKKNPLT